MKKKILSVLLIACMLFALTACSNDNTEGGKTPTSGVRATMTPTPAATATPIPEVTADLWEQLTDGELKDGKFAETRSITVEIFDRGNDGGTDPTNNMYTDYIKKGMLEDHNVAVEFVAVPRWTETEQLNNLLAAGTAPDICYTYSYPTIQTYAGMGAVLDIGTAVNELMPILPNVWNFLGDYNINYDMDPDTGELWAIEGKRANTNRIVTFVREDWLKKLNIAEPTTTQQFEDMLYKFKENASTLLGADADKLIPFSVSFDVGWRAALIIESFIDPEISDKEYYINAFDDRKFTENGTKEAIRLLNKWYNDGLMWNDFILYTTDSTKEDDMLKAGYIGAFQHNWDYPYRAGDDSINANLKRAYGEDAGFIAIDPFTDKNGNHTKFGSDSVDRKVFFPATNDEMLASLLYVDWISAPEHIEYLQIGDKDITHKVLDNGAIQIVAATGANIQNSGQNIDYTMTCNGLKFVDPEVTTKSLALSYAGIESRLIEKAHTVANTDLYVPRRINVGKIESEEAVGEALKAHRDVVFDNAVAATPDKFDSVWDKGFQDYLDMGGQDIIDERTEKWAEFFGDVENLPD